LRYNTLAAILIGLHLISGLKAQTVKTTISKSRFGYLSNQLVKSFEVGNSDTTYYYTTSFKNQKYLYISDFCSIICSNQNCITKLQKDLNRLLQLITENTESEFEIKSSNCTLIYRNSVALIYSDGKYTYLTKGVIRKYILWLDSIRPYLTP